MLNVREYTCIDPDWETYNAPLRFTSEDDYWNAIGEAHERAEREAMRSAEISAELWEFESDEDRDSYIDKMFSAEYERLCREYEKAL